MTAEKTMSTAPETSPRTIRAMTRNRIENAIVKESMGNTDGALQELNRALHDDPDNPLIISEIQEFHIRRSSSLSVTTPVTHPGNAAIPC